MIIIKLFFSLLLFANSIKGTHSQVELISANKNLVRGETNYLAIHFQMDPHWHIYWKNPGDSGKEPKIKWLETDNLEPSPLIWPDPTKIPLETLMNFGYENEVSLPFTIDVPQNFEKKSVLLKANLSWLICKTECLPAKAQLQLKLDINDQAKHSANYYKIQQSLNRVPLKNNNLTASFTTNNFLKIKINFSKVEIPPFNEVYFYPSEPFIINHAAKQTYELKNKELVLDLIKDDELDPNLGLISGVLELQPIDKNLKKITYDIDVIKEASENSFWLLLIFAFLGGMILNLMPCVFPVLSLKILGFVHQAKDHPSQIKNHGWYYTFGVLCSFWFLTAILMLLRSSGNSVGWGFQLQSPYFVSAMIYLFFFIGLNLLGFFEIGESFASLGSKGAKEGYASSFQTGILTTIVASPCTAPFMGAAIGVAFTMSAFYTFAIFTSLALGVSFPYLLLSYFPSWLKVLPKPGLWMQKFKEILAFPMFLTMLWLLWVLQLQTSSIYIFSLLISFIFILFLFWLAKYYPKKKILWLFLGGAIIAYGFMQIPSKSPNTEASKTSWSAYSEQKLASLLKEGRPIFLDFTASWCITCQVNKKLVLHTDEIQAFFIKNNISTIQADWTNSDPEITKKLAEFGRNSVPLYVFFPKNGGKPKVLPEILTKKMILDLIQ